MSTAEPTDHLDLGELRAICLYLAAQHDVLFRTLGEWVATTTPPAAQQLFAEAGHRHAWHAELWRDRAPVIPLDDDECAILAVDNTGDRLIVYRDALERIIALTNDVDARAHPTLDPGTHRVAALTLADLADLTRRLDAVDPRVSGN